MIRHFLAGSEHQPMPGVRSVGAAEVDERLEVGILVRAVDSVIAGYAQT